MPHLHIEYSANLEMVIEPAKLCEAVRSAAADLDALPMPGIRVRAFRADHVAIADGDPKHGFVDIIIRMREGRTLETRELVANSIFETAKNYLHDFMATQSIALSLEVQEVSARLSPKTGTIRAHLANP